MNRKTLLIAAIIVVAIICLKNIFSSNQAVTLSPEAQQISNLWASFPEATVTVDTLYTIKDLQHGEGLMFSAINGNQQITFQSLLTEGADIEKYHNLVAHGMEHGNYVLVHHGGAVYGVTVKHMFAESLNSLPSAGWVGDSSRDIIYQSAPAVQNISKAAYLIDPSISVEGKKIEVTGYRVYGDKPYMLRFHIRGLLNKMPESFIQTMLNHPTAGHEISKITKLSAMKELYLIKIPLSFQNDVMGLSGSGAYFLNNKGVASDTLVGLQSDRVMMGYQDDNGNNVIQNVGIAIERVH